MCWRIAFASATASRSPCDSRSLCSVTMLPARCRRLGTASDSSFFDEFQDSRNNGHIFDERAGEGRVPPADFSAPQTGADAALKSLRSCLGPCVTCSCVRACRCRCMTTTMTYHHRDMTTTEAAYHHRGMPQSRTHKWTSEVRLEAPIAIESVRKDVAALISTQISIFKEHLYVKVEAQIGAQIWVHGFKDLGRPLFHIPRHCHQASTTNRTPHHQQQQVATSNTLTTPPPSTEAPPTKT